MEMKKAALGRMLNVGDLYDLQSESLTPQSVFTKLPPRELLHVDSKGATRVTFTTTDDLQEKLRLLEVDPNLGVSVLTDRIKLFGHSRCLNFDKPKGTQRVSMIYKTVVSEEKVRYDDEALRACLHFPTLETARDLHVVVGVQYGGVSVVCFDPEPEGEGLKGDFFLQDGRLDVSKLQNAAESKKLKITVHSDVVGSKAQEGLTKFIEGHAGSIGNLNEGKGTPIVGYLVSVPEFLKALRCHDNSVARTVHRYADDAFRDLVVSIESVRLRVATLEGISREIREFERHIEERARVGFAERLQGLERDFAGFKQGLGEIVDRFKSGEVDVEAVRGFVAGYFDVRLNPRKIDYFVKTFGHELEKVRVLGGLKEKGAHIVSAKALELELEKSPRSLVLYMGETVRKKAPGAYADALRLFGEKAAAGDGSKLFVVDVDIDKDVPFVQPKVRRFQKTKCVAEDVVREVALSRAMNFVKGPRGSCGKPRFSIPLAIPCPAHCDDSVKTWRCVVCEEFLVYEFGSGFVCPCGILRTEDATFRCDNARHGDFAAAKGLEPILKTLKAPRVLTFLVLGETRVGKTTFLKSVLDHRMFKGLWELEELGVERAVEGLTQDIETYVLQTPEMHLRFIDTPGLGRGLEEDSTNMDKIINTLRGVSEIHAICILHNGGAEYVLNELRKRIPRNTWNKHVLLISTKGTSCTDVRHQFSNSAPRYLSSIATEAFSDGDIENFEREWMESSMESSKMIRYVESLEPLSTSSIVTLHDVIGLVDDLTTAYRTLVTEVKELKDTTDYTKIEFDFDKKEYRDQYQARKKAMDLEVVQAKDALFEVKERCEKVATLPAHDTGCFHVFADDVIKKEQMRVAELQLDNSSVVRMQQARDRFISKVSSFTWWTEQPAPASRLPDTTTLEDLFGGLLKFKVFAPAIQEYLKRNRHVARPERVITRDTL